MRRPSIERLLPAAYQRSAGPGSVLGALLDAMEVLHAPTEETLAAVEDLFHPYRTPDRLVPFLARWMALDHVLPRSRPGTAAAVAAAGGEVARLPIPVGRLRDLVASAAELARRRGTAAGLRMFLEIAMGVVGFAVEEPPDRPFHVVVRVPPAARHRIEWIRRIVALEKPAAVTCEVVADGPEALIEEEEQDGHQ